MHPRIRTVIKMSLHFYLERTEKERGIEIVEKQTAAAAVATTTTTTTKLNIETTKL